jgi:hypothetical protein
MTELDENVKVHTEGADCWCKPDVTPMGNFHHCEVDEVHQIVIDTGDNFSLPPLEVS